MCYRWVHENRVSFTHGAHLLPDTMHVTPEDHRKFGVDYVVPSATRIHQLATNISAILEINSLWPAADVPHKARRFIQDLNLPGKDEV